MRIDTLTIVGVGLLGGSVGLAAQARGLARRVVGVGRDRAKLEAARAAGVIQDIADGIGSARPVVAKGLTAIRARRLIDTAHRRVRIIDPAGLEALALTGLP